jgi:hypothetical protein
MASSAPCLPTIGRVAYLYYFLGDPDSYNLMVFEKQ